MIHAFFYGLLLAFGLIIPLGVQNIFVFNQGASQPYYTKAIPSVLTAAICDTLLILIAVLGVSVAVFKMPFLRTVIFTFGFLFLMYMGWMTWKNSPQNRNENLKPFSAKRQIGFAASVSLLNPHALIDVVAVIGTNALHFSHNERWIYTFACILVSWLWFFVLATAGHFLQRLDNTGLLIKKINKLSAIIIWGVALYIAYQLLF